MGTAFDLVREKLDSHGSKIEGVAQNRFMAQCPHHADGRPSLEVKDKSGTVILACYAGCQVDDIAYDLGLEMKDLFDEDPEQSDRSIPVRSYVYEALNGSPWFIVDRYYPKTFRQRLPGTEPGDRGGLRDPHTGEQRQTILFRAPKLHRAMQADEKPTIWLVEGEKDVETAERHGLLATTAPMGAGKWSPMYSAFLKRAGEVVIVVDQDKIKADGSLGSGQQHGHDAYHSLRGVGVKVRVVAPAIGKDLSDHFDGGYGVEDFQRETSIYTRPRGETADKLQAMTFPPIKWAIKDLLPAGLTILGGPPKKGKSWISLDWCAAVALGGTAMGMLPTEQGSTMYLAREDTYRRLQQRMDLLLGGSGSSHPKALELVPQEVEWLGGEIGLANMTEWAEEVGDPTLVIIDTLQKVEPEMGEEQGERRRGGGAYAGNYSMMTRYKQWADEHNCAVVMVHHDRKEAAGAKGAPTSDPFSRISGTRGLTGAADTLFFLESTRGEPTGTLHVTGRDVVEQEMELNKIGPLWQALEVPQKI